MSLHRRRIARWTSVMLCVAALAAALFLLVDRYKGLLGNASAFRLGVIGQAIARYQEDHDGAFPTSLAELQRVEDLDPPMIVCPETHLWASDAASTFVYVGQPLTAATANGSTVVAYDPPGYVGGDGLDVLFGDGHTDWVTAADLPAVLARGGPAIRAATTRAR